MQGFALADALAYKQSIYRRPLRFSAYRFVLNKVDQISDENKAKVLKVIKTLQPEAKIIEATFGDVPVSDILSTESFDNKLQEVHFSDLFRQAYKLSLQ